MDARSMPSTQSFGGRSTGGWWYVYLWEDQIKNPISGFATESQAIMFAQQMYAQSGDHLLITIEYVPSRA